VIHNHYKALVLKSEAEKYWKLLPKSEGPADKGKAQEPALSTLREASL
jgi:hypothetical protein